MLISRRATLSAAALLCPLPLLAADAWPSKTVRLVVPFPAGGAVDQVARALGNAWSQSLGQQFIVDNKPGATGAIGAAEVARAQPDGYTLLFALDSHAVNHLINKSQPFDTFKAFDYLSLLVTLPQVIVVPAASPIRNLGDLINQARKERLSYGTTGAASTAHQNVARLLRSQKVQATHVPYRGAAPLTTDVVGGHLVFASGGLSVMLPQIQAGTLRALAVSTQQRSPLLADVPAIAETVPGHDVASWIGLVAPANLPPATREKILAATRTVMHSPDIRKSLQEKSFSVVTSTPEAFAQRVRSDAAALQDLVASQALVLE